MIKYWFVRKGHYRPKGFPSMANTLNKIKILAIAINNVWKPMLCLRNQPVHGMREWTRYRPTFSESCFLFELGFCVVGMFALRWVLWASIFLYGGVRGCFVVCVTGRHRAHRVILNGLPINRACLLASGVFASPLRRLDRLIYSSQNVSPLSTVCRARSPFFRQICFWAGLRYLKFRVHLSARVISWGYIHPCWLGICSLAGFSEFVPLCLLHQRCNFWLCSRSLFF